MTAKNRAFFPVLTPSSSLIMSSIKNLFGFAQIVKADLFSYTKLPTYIGAACFSASLYLMMWDPFVFIFHGAKDGF